MPDLDSIHGRERRIQVHIGGAWSAEDFSHLMRSVNDIYTLSAVLTGDLLRQENNRNRFFPLNRRKVRRLARERLRVPWLSVRRLHYGSPGSIDFTGMGVIAGHVKEFLLAIIDRFASRKFRAIELQENLRLADVARFSDDFDREQKLLEARRTEEIHVVELRLKHEELRRRTEENRTLELANFERESEFAMKVVRLCRENELTLEQAG